MSHKQVVVVSRKLSEAIGWVTSCVNQVPDSVENVQSFAEAILKLEKSALSNKFIEFKNAEWKYDVMSLL